MYLYISYLQSDRETLILFSRYFQYYKELQYHLTHTVKAETREVMQTPPKRTKIKENQKKKEKTEPRTNENRNRLMLNINKNVAD